MGAQAVVWADGSVSRVRRSDLDALRFGGAIPTRSAHKWSELSARWSDSDRLWRMGDYHGAVAVRELALNDARELQGIDPGKSTPLLLSAGYTSNIGHIAILGMHSIARSVGLLEQIHRTAIVGPQLGNRALLERIALNTSVQPMRGASFPLDTPPAWPLVERLQMINVNGRYVDWYQWWEDTVRLISVTGAPPPQPFLLEEEYEAQARTELGRLGLPQDAWFVGLHMRTSNYPSDPRSVDISTVMSAIKPVLDAGGWIIRFGTDGDEPVVQQRGVMDLAHLGSRQTDLHPYLLRHSEFVVSTNSGPSVVAMVMGTRLVVINATSIARNTLSTFSDTIYLPSVLQRSGEDQSLQRLLSSPFAWSEYTQVRDMPGAWRFRRNTPSEIEHAIVDMLDIAGLRPSHRTNSSAQDAMNELRRQSNCVSFGPISPSFLDSFSGR
jgi:putative glycosyltransferase (TIGR04372 family)